MLYFKKVLTGLALLSISVHGWAQKTAALKISHGNIQIEIDQRSFTHLSSLAASSKALTEGFVNSELLQIRGTEESGWTYKVEKVDENSIAGDNPGKEWKVTSVGMNGPLKMQKAVSYKVYDSTPGLVSTRVVWTNLSNEDVIAESWKNNVYQVISQQDKPLFWAFQGSSSKRRADWVRPLEKGYYEQNFMGMNDSDYGGGIPVTSVWRPDQGVAVGHLALVPKLVSLPTEVVGDRFVQVGVEDEMTGRVVISPKKSIETLETFVMVHDGDYYGALSEYSALMQKKGIKMAKREPAAFESIWCAWGYERDFTLDEIVGTLPKVKELGIKWVVLDDGFQPAEGDWYANKEKFPRGNAEIVDLVKSIHDNDMKAKVWWAPLAADPHSKLLADNPDMKIIEEDGSPQYITWWDAYYLSPTKRKVIEHTKETVNLFLKDWRFDGMKMDGQHMNAIAPDHSENTNVAHPNIAPEKLPEYFQMIYDVSMAINPHTVIENCPCGTCMSFFNMASMNQAVASDPLSSWQIRHKGKTYKALVPDVAYFGDHVELSDGADDFASSFGIGAVLGTKFTWPKDNPAVKGSFLLTPKKEKVWKKWFSLYDEKMLSTEEYLGGLYDIGYHIPEAHVVKKGNTLHYAFYNNSWKGKLEFKGLDAGKKYEIYDYYNDRVLGVITGVDPFLNVEVKGFLLTEARLIN